ncbi:restriction endonuclease subunit S [Phocaeicola vulgatus]|uniref:Restriction endonuclease subunit S n=1 Tax=Phocaeicola vulgatus TaxID=821 RepID=A0AAE8APZ0_PHOVU|nr:restriction endonuclease subunit S [Phocaeicola vulgatus]RGW50840.1 restriction endonuclease subunit S [Phocaeicola vulgatus]
MANNNENKILNVPNLRFPEFCGEWETIKVSELLDFYSTNSLSWEQLDYSNGKIKNLHYGLIHKGVPTMVDVACDSLPYIKEESMLKSFTLFKEGDVAFADASEDTNDVAKAIEVVNCDNQQIVSGLHTIHGRDNSNRTVIGYKGYAFASDSFHKQIRRIAQGTKVFSISVRNFDEAYIGIPSKEEQTQIAKLLITIDKRIATQNKIIEKYESLIKGLNNILLYGTEGKYVCLGDILLERSERSRTNNQHEVLSSTVKGIFSQREYFSKDIASENNVGYKIIRLHDVVLSPQNLWMGNINYNDRFDIGIVSPSYKVFSIADGYDNQFVAAMLKTYRALYSYMMVSEQGASIVRRNLNMEAFLQLVFKIPSLDKQREIGYAISLLKYQLKTANKIIRAYISQKKYLLRQMFI